MQAAADERIDVLGNKIDEGFAEMRAEFTAVHAEFKSVRSEVRTEFKAVRAEIREESDAGTSEVRAEIHHSRSEARADFRTLVAVTFAMWTTTMLGCIGVLVSRV